MNPYRQKKIVEFNPHIPPQEAWRQYRLAHPEQSFTHGIMSIDLSQIELVLIGEMSGDSAFRDAYGQLPYKDLHQTAAASILAAVTQRPDFTRDDFLALRAGKNNKGIPLLDAKGQALSPEEAYKYNRGNAGGKGANFEFWYSGSLATLAERRGLGSGAIQTLTQAYCDAFPEAVAWRQEKAAESQRNGFLELPDGHRRVRFEATFEWQALMSNYFRQLGEGLDPEARRAITSFGDIVVRKISTRAKNQLINALIQGSCAAIIKRSILSILEGIVQFDARFLFPVHDELVFSVNYDHMLPFMKFAKPIMANHPDFISNLVMNSSTSIGRSFQKYHPTKCPYGQIELDEAPKELAFVPVHEREGVMSDETILKIVEYLKQ